MLGVWGKAGASPWRWEREADGTIKPVRFYFCYDIYTELVKIDEYGDVFVRKN